MATKPRVVEVPQDEFLNHAEEYNGFCTECMEFTNFGGVEPDAEKYECESCGNHTVMGAEQALIMGLVTFSEDDG